MNSIPSHTTHKPNKTTLACLPASQRNLRNRRRIVSTNLPEKHLSSLIIINYLFLESLEPPPRKKEQTRINQKHPYAQFRPLNFDLTDFLLARTPAMNRDTS